MGLILAGRTLGLLGLGRIGKRMAQYAQVFGMEVTAWSQNLTAEAASAVGVRCVNKDELFGSADILSIHVQLSDRTRGLVTARELALMKPDAYLVNTSRGPIVDEAALISALREGRLAKPAWTSSIQSHCPSITCSARWTTSPSRRISVTTPERLFAPSGGICPKRSPPSPAARQFGWPILRCCRP